MTDASKVRKAAELLQECGNPVLRSLGGALAVKADHIGERPDQLALLGAQVADTVLFEAQESAPDGWSPYLGAAREALEQLDAFLTEPDSRQA